MLLTGVRVINFDNSVTAQEELLRRFSPSMVDLIDLGPSCRLWLNNKNKKRIIRFLKGKEKHAITFLGSGDFHHISSLLIEQFTQDLSVIVFDCHPDWEGLPPRLACGAWVSNTLRRNNIKKVVLLGVSSQDIDGPALRTAALRYLRDDRVEIYPYAHAPSSVFLGRVPNNTSLTLKRSLFSTMIGWQELKGKDLQGFFGSLIARLPTKQVYISIDKDCLGADFSLTNWEEGMLTLDELLDMLVLAKKDLDIVGVDIVGEYSPVKVKGAIKSIVSRIDHPKNFSALGKSETLVRSVNQRTNIRILEALRTP